MTTKLHVLKVLKTEQWKSEKHFKCLARAHTNNYFGTFKTFSALLLLIKQRTTTSPCNSLRLPKLHRKRHTTDQQLRKQTVEKSLVSVKSKILKLYIRLRMLAFPRLGLPHLCMYAWKCLSFLYLPGAILEVCRRTKLLKNCTWYMALVVNRPL